MSDIFKAIADPTRREILLMLVKQPSSVNSIVEHFDMSRPAVSKHLKILRNCDLLKIEVDKEDTRQRNCYAQLEAMKEVEDYLQELEKFWKTKLSGLDDFLNKAKNK